MAHQVLLLHGAIGSSQQMKPLADLLAANGFTPKLFDFIGHGGREMPKEAFSISLFAKDVIKWMDDNSITKIDILGYSMGGYVALYMARHYPERVGDIQTVATKFAWNVATAEKEVKMLNPDKIVEKIPKFAAMLEQRHAPMDWKEVLKRTGNMMFSMGTIPPLTEVDFNSVKHTVGLCVGDGDTMVTLEETIGVCRQLPDAGFTVLPDTPHPIEQMKPEVLLTAAKNFFIQE